MPITFNCDCGKAFSVKDEYAGRRTSCPACGAALTVPAPAAGELSDVEVVNDDPPVAKPAPARVKAVAAAKAEPEPEAEKTAPAPAKKKKKKKKKRVADDEESDRDTVDRVIAAERRMKRIVRGVAFIVFGLAIIVGVIIVFTVYREDIKFSGARAVGGMVIFGLMGIAAVGKGVIGLCFGQFLGDDDGPG